MSSTYRKWIQDSYTKTVSTLLREKPDEVKNAILNNPRKEKFIDSMLREVKQLELAKPLMHLNEDKIKDAVESFCEFHLKCVLRNLEVKFNDELIKREAEEADFKIDEETGCEVLDD